MDDLIRISELMESSGVKFGTSGARGLVADMTDRVCYIYTTGFMQYLLECAQLTPDGDRRVALAGDLRPSTGRIMVAIAKAVHDAGFEPVNCGRIPSPAVAYYGLRERIPSIMVTGSHIPDDRNGIKFNTAFGEVLKKDEEGIARQQVQVPDIFDTWGMLREDCSLPREDDGARVAYVARWLEAFPADFLAGTRIGLYQHSAVGREIMSEIYRGLGAEVLPFGFSESFVPVDTEAVRPEDIELAAEWAKENAVTAIVSTDGDSDRPLISDENGNWLRGDVAGILAAIFCQAEVVVVPVSCNTAVELCGKFQKVRRCRIGSPFVIAGMVEEQKAGASCVVGYEANGGFLQQTPVSVGEKALAPLPTRDPVIVHLAVLGLARGGSVSRLLSHLPERATASDRLKDFPQEVSRRKIEELSSGGGRVIEPTLPQMGPVRSTDMTDGLRILFTSGEILHFRPSGNAPELRCYAEAGNAERAAVLVRIGLDFMRTWK